MPRQTWRLHAFALTFALLAAPLPSRGNIPSTHELLCSELAATLVQGRRAAPSTIQDLNTLPQTVVRLQKQFDQDSTKLKKAWDALGFRERYLGRYFGGHSPLLTRYRVRARIHSHHKKELFKTATRLQDSVHTAMKLWTRTDTEWKNLAESQQALRDFTSRIDELSDLFAASFARKMYAHRASNRSFLDGGIGALFGEVLVRRASTDPEQLFTEIRAESVKARNFLLRNRNVDRLSPAVLYLELAIAEMNHLEKSRGMDIPENCRRMIALNQRLKEIFVVSPTIR